MFKIFIFLSIFIKFLSALGYNCHTSLVVQTLNDGFEKDVLICLRCADYYILSQDYSQCLHGIHQMGQQGFLNCQRIGHTGSCAEAVFGIDIIGKDELSFVTSQVFGDRCAVLDPSYLTCNYPRFGFVLDYKKQVLWEDTERTFCALFDSELNSCREYFAGFIYDGEAGRTFYLGSLFKNPNKVIQNGKGPSGIECNEGYEFIQKRREIRDIFNQKYEKIELIGCFKKVIKTDQLDQSIDNCEEYLYSTTICKKCGMGYSLSLDGQQCKMITSHCEVFEIYFGEEICSKCKPFYRKQYRECVRHVGCNVVSETDKSECIGCSQKYYLKKGECVKSDLNSQQNCVVQGEKDNCLKCIHPEKYYPKGNLCLERKLSVHCAQKRDDRDGCVAQCEEGYVFAKQIKQIEIGNGSMFNIYGKYQNYYKLKEFAFIQYDLHDNLREQTTACVKRNNTIEFCEIYSPIADTCLQCKRGYQRVLIKLDKEQEMYDCKQLNLPIKKSTIENCLEYDINEQFCQKCQQYYFYDDQIDKCVFLEGCLYPTFFDLDPKYKKDKSSIDQCELSRKQKYYKSDYDQEIRYNKKTIEYKVKDKIASKPNLPTLSFSQEPCFERESDKQCSLCYQGYALDKVSQRCIRDIKFPNCKVIDEVLDLNDEDSNMNSKNNDGSNIDDSANFYKTKIDCLKCSEGYVLNRGVCICQKGTDCRVIYTCNESKGCFKELKRGYSYNRIFLANLLRFFKKYYVETRNRSQIYLSQRDQEYMIDECSYPDCDICSADSCYQCRDGYFFHKRENKCTQICRNSTSCVDPEIVNNINELQSQPCHKRYENEGRCVGCAKDLFLWLDEKCYEECPLSHTQAIIFGANFCYQCPENCLTCTIKELYYVRYGAATCLACLPGKIFMAGRCYSECAYYSDEDNNCYEECPSGMFTHEKKCVKSCPRWYGKIPQQPEKMRCIDECIEEYTHYYPDKPFYCARHCDDGYVTRYEEKKNNTCLKCLESNCASCQIQDQTKCTKCYGDYFLTEDHKCRYQCFNGEIVNQAQECQLKCKQPYCSKCSENNKFCEKCIDGFQLSTSLTCYCEPGKFVNKRTGKCNFCHPECKSCDQNDGCSECNEGFYLINKDIVSQISTNNNKFESNTFTCTQVCQLGTYPAISLSTNGNNNQVAACLKCPQVGCISCNSSTECLDCSGKFHLKYDPAAKKYSCECKPGYFLDGNECRFQCANLRIVEHEKDCCLVENCDLCQRNPDQCERCNSLFPLLFDNKCMRSCPDGAYVNEEGNKCQKCHPLCLTCEKSSTQCTSCSLPSSITNLNINCKCILGYYYHQGKCVAECPLYSYVNSKDPVSSYLKVCESYCNENKNQHPVFNKAGSFISCETLSNDSYESSLFCEQHLTKLYQLLKLELVESQKLEFKKGNMNLNITLSSTPLSCYTFKLKGLLDFEVEMLSVDNHKNQNIFVLRYSLNEKELSDSNLVFCSQDYCYLDFEIYQNSELKLTVKIKLNISMKVAVMEGVKDPKIISSTSSSLIDSKTLEKNQTLPSNQQVECASGSVCNYRNITTALNTPISITLTAIQQYLTSQHTLEIQSIYLVSEDDEQQIQPIKNYYFENFFSLNTLKVTLSFEREVTGKLVIVCGAKLKTTNNNELSEGNEDKESKEAPQFLVSQTHLNVKRSLEIQKENKETTQPYSVSEEGNSNLSFNFILLLFNTVISSVIFIYCLFKVYQFFSKKSRITGFKKMTEESQDRVESISIELK